MNLRAQKVAACVAMAFLLIIGLLSWKPQQTIRPDPARVRLEPGLSASVSIEWLRSLEVNPDDGIIRRSRGFVPLQAVPHPTLPALPAVNPDDGIIRRSRGFVPLQAAPHPTLPALPADLPVVNPSPGLPRRPSLDLIDRNHHVPKVDVDAVK